jgi:hypothetical protein
VTWWLCPTKLQGGRADRATSSKSLAAEVTPVGAGVALFFMWRTRERLDGGGDIIRQVAGLVPLRAGRLVRANSSQESGAAIASRSTIALQISGRRRRQRGAFDGEPVTEEAFAMSDATVRPLATPAHTGRRLEKSVSSVAVAEAAERRLLFDGTTTTFTPVTTGDFNGDGSGETLVIVSAGRARLAQMGFIGPTFRRGSLLLLDSDGALFGDALGLRVRGNATPVTAVGDFNGDGHADLVISGRRVSGLQQGLTFLAGNGDGTFQPGVAIAGAPNNVTSLAAADVNSDGHLDLVGTALVRNGGNKGNNGGLTFAQRTSNVRNPEGTTDDLGPSDFGAHRPHIIGVTAEAGAGILDGSVTLPSGGVFASGGTGADLFTDVLNLGGSGFNDRVFDVDSSLAPGFIPPAARVGVSAEAGGARLGGLFSDTISVNDQPFVLLGNGDGTFTTSDSTTLG